MSVLPSTGEANTGSLSEQVRRVSRLLPYLARHRRLFAWVVACEVCLLAGGIAVSAASVTVAARMVVAEPTVMWLATLVVGALAVAAVSWADMWLAHVLAYRVILDVRSGVHRAISRLAPLGLGRRRMGDTSAAALSDAEALEWFYAHTVGQVLACTVVALGVSGVLAWWSWPLGVLAVGAQLALLGLSLVFRPLAERQGSALRQTTASLSADYVESRTSAREVVLLGRERAFAQSIKDGSSAIGRVRKAIAVRQGAELSSTEALTATALIGTVLLVTVGPSAGRVAPQDISGVIVLAGSALLPIVAIVAALQKLGEMSSASHRIAALADAPATNTAGSDLDDVSDDDSEGDPDVPDDTAHDAGLTLTDVQYTYPGADKPTLRGVTAEVAPGETVALVGASGAGKSTLVHLVGRLMEPTAGHVTRGVVPYADEHPRHSRQRVLVIEQRPHIFRGSVLANVTMGHPRVSADDAKRALAQVDLAEHFAAQPDGFDTDMAELGGTLSGGQKARLALARCLVRDVDVIVLDEPTAEVDAITEERLLAMLREHHAEATVVIVSHRPSTIAACDRTLFLDDGTVVGEGPHRDLWARNAAYREVLGGDNTKGGDTDAADQHC